MPFNLFLWYQHHDLIQCVTEADFYQFKVSLHRSTVEFLGRELFYFEKSEKPSFKIYCVQKLKENTWCRVVVL